MNAIRTQTNLQKLYQDLKTESLAGGSEQSKQNPSLSPSRPQRPGPAPVGTGSAPGAAPGALGGGTGRAPQVPGFCLALCARGRGTRPGLSRRPRAHPAAQAQSESRAGWARGSPAAWESSAHTTTARSRNRAPFFLGKQPGQGTTHLQMDPGSSPSRLFAARPQTTGSESAREEREKKSPTTSHSGSLFILKLQPSRRAHPLSWERPPPAAAPPSHSRRGPITAQFTAHPRHRLQCPGPGFPRRGRLGFLPRCGGRRSPEPTACGSS